MDIIGAKIVKNVIEKFAEPLTKKLIEMSKDEWEKFKIDFDFAFTNYISKSYEKYSKIKTILYKTEPQYIYDFFECPKLLQKPNTTVGAQDVNDILDISNFIIIEGTGGIGKSTLLKHFFINELEKKDLIPLFIELKDVNLIEGDYSILDIVYQKLSDLGSSIKPEYMEYALESGCFLFLLDGYDEIVSDRKDTFFKKLDQFCDKYTDNFFIISSRPYSEFVEFQRFTVLSSLPLSKEQAKSLVLKINFEAANKERFIQELDEKLYDSHESFASNPLLLNIMLLTFDNYADIPEKLHLFYSNAFETLYSRHDATKAGYKREMLSGLSYDSFRKIFAYFCFLTYTRGMLEFTYEELREIMKQIKIPRVEFEVDNYIFDLENSLCVIYKDGIKYTFSHRSFQEYFSAVFLKELSDENLQKYGTQLVKREPFRASHDSLFEMLFDMAEERFEKNILLPILIEIEEGLTEDKYSFYFKELVDELMIDRDDDDGIRLWVHRGIRNDCLAVFINCFAGYYRIHDNKKSIEGVEATEELYQYLVNKRGYEYCDKIRKEEVIEDEIIWNLLKKTWIGRNIQCIVDLREVLIEKQETNDDILSSFISFEANV